MTHTCIDELIDVQDDKRWAEAMESRKTCPVCILKTLQNTIAETLPKIRVITKEPKVRKGLYRI
jgi:hypothetical protein